MLWFKNAIIYQLNKDNLVSKDIIEQAVKSMPFIPCGSQDTTKFGWVSPYGEDSEQFVLEMQGQMLLRVKKESKILPSPVIKQAWLAKIDKLETAQQRKLKKIEKDALKDEVMIDLLPRAFSKYNHAWLWIDTVNRRLIVDAGSHKQAEDILALLRKGMGSLAITPLHHEPPLEQLMTTWVKENIILPPFLLGDEAELKDPLDGNGIIRCKNQELTAEEIISHIDAGKQITKLKLFDEEMMSFILNNDLTIKRIKYETGLLDKNEDIDREDKEQRLEADFVLMTGALSNMINSLINVINQLSSSK